MPDATSFLTRKFGPLPVWTYAVAGAALVSLVLLYRRGQSSMQAQQPAMPAGTNASSSQGVLNYPPTVVVTPQGITNTNPGTTQPSGTQSPAQPLQPGSTALASIGNGQPNLVVRPGASGSDLWQIDGYIPDRSMVTITGPPVSGHWSGGDFLAVPISFAGRNTWINAIQLQPPGLGGGAAGGRVGHGMRTLVTHPVQPMGHDWNHFVPFQPQQFVHTGRGGLDGPSDSDGMGGIARRTGIPLVRLRSLNYHLRTGSGVFRRGIVRIS